MGIFLYSTYCNSVSFVRKGVLFCTKKGVLKIVGNILRTNRGKVKRLSIECRKVYDG
jgi:hypothetical protein